MAGETYKITTGATLTVLLLAALLVGGGLVGCPYYKV